MKTQKSWRDPIVEEIHRHWDEYAKKFDYDLEKICLDLRRRQEERGGKGRWFPSAAKTHLLIHRSAAVLDGLA